MVWQIVGLVAVCTWGLVVNSAVAEEVSSELCAKKLQASTLTVRIQLSPLENAKLNYADNEEALTNAEETQVTVCTGVAIGEQQVITAAFAAADSQIRITLTGGQQHAAKVRVFDEFSGLALLDVPEAKLTPLLFAEGQPDVASAIMTAAGWGAEPPVVSQGIIGSVARTLKGTIYPPLLQCDIRPVETSCGAAIVNRKAQLLGIVVATEGPDLHRGWTYAVPVSHVQRLLRAKNEKAVEGAITVLKRRRPTVGLVLEGTEQGVFVSRLTPESPAAKAGFQPGDKILTVEGKQVRSVYEAVRPSLYKQPGDLMKFSVEREKKQQEIEVVLGGGVELEGASLQVLGQLVQPKLDFNFARGKHSRATDAKEVQIRNNYAPQLQNNAVENSANTKRVAGDRVLEESLERYRTLVDQQQSQLDRREEEQRQQSETIQALQAELKQLQEQVNREGAKK